AVRRICAAQRVDPLARTVVDEERVHFAVANGLERVLGLGQARSQLFQLGGLAGLGEVLGHRRHTGRMSSPSRTRSVLERSPITRRSGRGSFLINVGAAMICS